MGFIVGWFLGMWIQEITINKVTDYFDKPYCQEVSLGKDKVKKCWKLVEIKE